MALLMQLSLAAMLVLALFPAGAQADAPVKSDNIKLVKSFRAPGVADLTYDGRYVYALDGGEDGGLRIYDPRKLQEVAFFKCPVYSDAKALEPGLVAIDAGPPCGGLQDWGVVLLDTSNPKKVRVLGAIPAVFHTFRNFPGERILYLSPNGCCGDTARGVETIVDASDPRAPKMAGEYVSDGLGCHDIWIHVSEGKKLAACAGGSETQIWDVSDPFAPVTLSRIPTPQTFFNHSAAISDDGKLLVVGDEAHVATECVGGPLGDLWIYDISDPTLPILKGEFTLTRGTAVSSYWVDPSNDWCSAHNYEFIPGTHVLMVGWYAGGMNVIDLSEPSAPREVAYYMEDAAFVWGGYWIEGRVWTSDWEGGDELGIDVYEVEGLRAGRRA